MRDTLLRVTPLTSRSSTLALLNQHNSTYALLSSFVPKQTCPVSPYRPLSFPSAVLSLHTLSISEPILNPNPPIRVIQEERGIHW